MWCPLLCHGKNEINRLGVVLHASILKSNDEQSAQVQGPKMRRRRSFA
jgi:hypothetical protein